MAAPVIDPTQSIPDFKQWMSWFYQPQADNDATSWTVSGLPPGLLLDTATGRISGAVTRPGNGAFTLRAFNADGGSAPVRFYYGIRPAAQPVAAGAIDTTVDLETGFVTFAGLDAKTGPARKRGDNLYLHTRFVRDGLGVDIPMRTFTINLKNDETQPPLLTSGAFLKVGTGENAIYLLHLTLAMDDATLDANSEAAPPPTADAQIADPSGAVLARSLFTDLLGELQITFDRAWAFGPATPRWSTQTFPFRLVRDLAA